MEYPQGKDELCNKRKNIDVLMNNYPTIDYCDIKDEEPKWSQTKESIKELEQRIQDMLKYIRNRPEKKIAIVSHSSFIGQYLNGKTGDYPLIHCHPYGPYNIEQYKL